MDDNIKNIKNAKKAFQQSFIKEFRELKLNKIIKMNILYDLEFYGKRFHNISTKYFEVEIYYNYMNNDLNKPKIIIHQNFKETDNVTEKDINKIKKEYIFSHKVRVFTYYYRDRFIEITKFFKHPEKVYGAYNRAYDIDLEDVDKQYKRCLRKCKLQKIVE